MNTSHHHHNRLRRGIKLHLTTTTVVLLLFAPAVSSLSFNPSQFSLGVREMKEEVVVRRRLGGLGSSPPTCRSKCGRCAPCEPVHVPIHPGFAMKLEYYPEAWRCKCRNRLFMP